MKRKPKFWIVMLSAGITFATLFAFLGKPPMMKHHDRHCHTAAQQIDERK
ncbi:MAG: hypothetical protein JNJ58_11985 [Chitinophagaceae bacterium]|nr:hypothetical protein [Chitinophagaceae bacterium]